MRRRRSTEPAPASTLRHPALATENTERKNLAKTAHKWIRSFPWKLPGFHQRQACTTLLSTWRFQSQDFAQPTLLKMGQRTSVSPLLVGPASADARDYFIVRSAMIGLWHAYCCLLSITLVVSGFGARSPDERFELTRLKRARSNFDRVSFRATAGGAIRRISPNKRSVNGT